MIKRLVLILALLIPTVLWADPSISGISGTYTHGSTDVVISGLGFGTKSTAAPNLFDRVDSVIGATAYTGITNGGVVPSGGSYPWGNIGSSYIRYSTDAGDQRHARSSASYRGQDNDYQCLEKRSPGTSGDLYVSFWYRSSIGIAYASGSDKYIRAGEGDEFGEGNNFSGTQYQTYLNASDGGSCSATTYDGFAPEGGVWYCVELFFNNTTKDFYVYTDGALLSHEDWDDGGCSSTSVYWIRELGFGGNGSLTPRPRVTIDDIYVDSTAQRVMIGNASTYAECTSFEMQPATEWSATSVTLTLNQGAFSDGAKAYVYVVDSDNVANATGKEITFGSSGSPALQPTMQGCSLQGGATQQ